MSLKQLSTGLTNLQSTIIDSAFGLQSFALKFKEMPTLNISPALSSSELLAKIDPASAGTILKNAGDAPSAVIFNMKQMKTVQNVVDYIPSLLETLKTAFAKASELHQLSEISLLADPLKFSIGRIMFATVVVAVGAFLLGEASKDKNESYAKYIPGAAILTIGTLRLSLAAFRINECAETLLNIGKRYRNL